MEYNIQEQVNLLVKSAEDIWVPQWFNLFSNPHGGFYERLDNNGAPLELPRRLLGQCRQIIVYSLTQDKRYKEKLDESFAFIRKHYFIPETGGSVFSLNKDNKVRDHTYDLYAHAFILLTCAQYYKFSQNEDALTYAKTTLNFIKDKFVLPIGYAESLDENLNPSTAIRRQNPHMHLLEGCVFMYGVTKDHAYKDVADTLVFLFLNKFFDTEKGVLHEFFDEDLNVHPQEGDKVESGHHGEWIWLLSHYKTISNDHKTDINNAIDHLFQCAMKFGVDYKNGGVFNTQNGTTGQIIDSNKRIWTTFETLRAADIMCASTKHKESAQKIVRHLLESIQKHYVDINTGNWHEILDENMNPITNYMPATTPYHIYPILKGLKT